MLSINFRMKNSKGFFVTIIVALLILLLLGTISTRIIEKRNTSKANKELIEIKDLTYNRSEFEYNVKNAIKEDLNIKIEETQEEDALTKDADDLLKNILEEYNIPTSSVGPPVTKVKVTILVCIKNACIVEYTYSVSVGVTRDIQKNGKKIKYKIPVFYTISDIVPVVVTS